MVMSGIVHSSGAFLLQNPHSMSENSLYLRATFFYNQMRVRNDVKMTSSSPKATSFLSGLSD